MACVQCHYLTLDFCNCGRAPAWLRQRRAQPPRLSVPTTHPPRPSPPTLTLSSYTTPCCSCCTPARSFIPLVAAPLTLGTDSLTDPADRHAGHPAQVDRQVPAIRVPVVPPHKLPGREHVARALACTITTALGSAHAPRMEGAGSCWRDTT